MFLLPQATFRQLGPSFPGWNLNKYEKLCIFSYICFMLKDYQKPHLGTHCKGNLNYFFFFNSLFVYDNWYTEASTYK